MITNEVKDFSKIDFQNGEVILVDKPFKWTSFDVVNKIRRSLNVKKVGHSGTLDPLATGLLIVCTGKKTKELNNYQGLNKTYTGTMTLGIKTNSMDLDTEIIEKVDVPDFSEDELLKIRDRFLGEIEQIPPMFSALKKNGKPLYKLARKGKTVEREARKVTVHKFELKKITLPEIEFEIECSKGTYIRVIANDFGEALGCGAVISSLRRTRIGEFSIDDAINVEKLNN